MQKMWQIHLGRMRPTYWRGVSTFPSWRTL